MARQRLVYQNRLVDLGFDPRREGGGMRDEKEIEDQKRMRLIQTGVSRALEVLTSDEREIVERIHFMGQSYREMSEKSGRAMRRLEALHRRAIRRLRKELRPLVRELYGIDSPPPKCVICRSPMRREIDRIIEQHDERRSWRTVIRRIGDECGVRIRTPQTLIGHKKYH